MYEDFHLESDYEDRNGGSLILDDWDMYDEYDDLDEGHMPDNFGGWDDSEDLTYSGSFQDSDISNDTYDSDI